MLSKNSRSWHSLNSREGGGWRRRNVSVRFQDVSYIFEQQVGTEGIGKYFDTLHVLSFRCLKTNRIPASPHSAAVCAICLPIPAASNVTQVFQKAGLPAQAFKFLWMSGQKTKVWMLKFSLDAEILQISERSITTAERTLTWNLGLSCWAAGFQIKSAGRITFCK